MPRAKALAMTPYVVILNVVKNLKVSETVDGRANLEMLEFLYLAPPRHNK